VKPFSGQAAACCNYGEARPLRWMAGNVAIEQDAADNWKPSKKKSQERIDGIVTLVMAIDLATRYVERASIYNEPGGSFL